MALISLIVAVALAGGGASIAWGSSKQKQEELADQQSAMALTMAGLGLRVSETEKTNAVVLTKLDAIRLSLDDKASKDSVDALKDSIDEIKTMLGTALRRRQKEHQP